MRICGNQREVSVTEETKIRIDKWLWAARLYKTRALAAKAVESGQVRIQEQRLKPSRFLRIGEQLEVTKNKTVMQVIVVQLAAKRGPAAAAQQLYRKTEFSRQVRREVQQNRQSFSLTCYGSRKKPDKRGRRSIRKLLGKIK